MAVTPFNKWVEYLLLDYSLLNRLLLELRYLPLCQDVVVHLYPRF